MEKKAHQIADTVCTSLVDDAGAQDFPALAYAIERERGGRSFVSRLRDNSMNLTFATDAMQRVAALAFAHGTAAAKERNLLEIESHVDAITCVMLLTVYYLVLFGPDISATGLTSWPFVWIYVRLSKLKKSCFGMRAALSLVHHPALPALGGLVRPC